MALFNYHIGSLLIIVRCIPFISLFDFFQFNYSRIYFLCDPTNSDTILKMKIFEIFFLDWNNLVFLRLSLREVLSFKSKEFFFFIPILETKSQIPCIDCYFFSGISSSKYRPQRGVISERIISESFSKVWKSIPSNNLNCFISMFRIWLAYNS